MYNQYQTLLLIVLISLIGVFTPVASLDWGYNESISNILPPSRWSEYSNSLECNEAFQSPIDIRSQFLRRVAEYSFNVTYGQDVKLWVRNTGHAIEVFASNVTATSTRTSFRDNFVRVNGVLDENYRLEVIQFHWSQSQKNGSEHTIDGRFYPGEVQFYHVRPKFASLAEAIASGEPNAVCAVAIFMEIAEKASPVMREILDTLDQVVYPGTMTNLSGPIRLGEMIPNNTNFYTYRGSLTSPGCNEVVQWVVLQKTTPITKRYLSRLQGIQLLVDVDQRNSPVYSRSNNIRARNPVNDREVTASLVRQESGATNLYRSTAVNASWCLLGVIAALIVACWM